MKSNMTNSGLCAGGVSGGVGLVNGGGKSFGVTNGNGMVNGMVNGNGMINGTGMVNGNGLVNRNGLTNGNSFVVRPTLIKPKKKFTDYGVVAIFLVVFLLLSTLFVGLIYTIPSVDDEALIDSYDFVEGWGCEGRIDVYENSIRLELDTMLLSDLEYANSVYVWLFLENSTGASVPSLWGSSDLLISCVLHEDVQSAVAFTSGLNLKDGVVGGVSVSDSITISFSRFQLGLQDDIVVDSVCVAMENRDGLLVDSQPIFDKVSPSGVSSSFSDTGMDSLDDVVEVSISMDERTSFVSMEFGMALLFIPHKLYRVVTEREDAPPKLPVDVVRPEDKPTFIPTVVKEPYYGVSIRSGGVERVGVLFNHEGFEGDISSLSVDDNVVVFSTDSFRLWGCDEVVFSSSWGVSDIIEIEVKSDVPTKAVGDGYSDNIARVLILSHGTGNNNATFGTYLSKYNYNYTIGDTTAIPSIEDLLDYEFVILTAGDSTGAIATAQADTLWSFVNQSGHLLIEGGEIGYEMRDEPCFQDLFLATAWATDTPAVDLSKATGEYDDAVLFNESVAVTYGTAQQCDALSSDYDNITTIYNYEGYLNTPFYADIENPAHIVFTFDITLFGDLFSSRFCLNMFQNLRANERRISKHPSLTIDGDDSDWLGTSSSIDDTVVTSRQEIIWNDVVGDDNGNGSFSYPSGGRWSDDSLDITEFRICSDGSYVYLLYEFLNLTNNQSYANGFSEAIIKLAWGDGSIMALNNNTNVSVIEGVTTSFIVHGRGVAYYNGSWSYNPAGVSIVGNTTNNLVEMRFPLTLCGFSVGDTVPLYSFVGADDDNGGFKDITSTLGKTDSSHPNVYDFIFTVNRTLVYEGTSLFEETLRPNATGFVNTWDVGNYTHVNDESDATYIYQDGTTSPCSGLFNLDNSSVGAGDITQVKFYTTLRKNADGGGDTSATVQYRHNGTTTQSSSVALTSATWGTWVLTTTLNSDGDAWEWSDIEVLQAGVTGTESGAGGGNKRYTQCSEVWIEITYVSPDFIFASKLMIDILPQIIFNEVSTYGVGNDTEWIEFYNNGLADVNLSGYTVSNLGGETYTFGDVTVGVGNFTVLHIVPSTNTSTNSTGNVYWKTDTEFLNDTGGHIILNNTYYYRKSIDYMAYGSQTVSTLRDVEFIGVVPSAPAQDESLSRWLNGQDYDLGSDWNETHPTGNMIVTMGGENQVIPFLSNMLVLLVVVILFFVSKKREVVE